MRPENVLHGVGLSDSKRKLTIYGENDGRLDDIRFTELTFY